MYSIKEVAGSSLETQIEELKEWLRRNTGADVETRREMQKTLQNKQKLLSNIKTEE